MNYTVTDNFLSDEDFLKLKNAILGNEFPWYFLSTKVDFENSDHKNNFQFTHNFYSDYKANSTCIELINPILKIINPSAILRIKGNLTPITDTHILYDFHTDIKNVNAETAVFYVNTNDGYTLFEDGTKVKSVENRLLRFKSDTSHTGTSCTDQKVRCVINFNYYKWLD
jgi:hypothetical protein